jgi:hypothetical protein
VLDMLATFYAAAGNPPDADGALALMARVLAVRAEMPAINAALDRCLAECRFPIRLPDIIQRLPGTEAADVKAEKRLAWETVDRFVSKYVGNDIHGNYGPDFGWHGPQLNYRGEIVKAASYPQLCDRILDTVRRTGGWKVYALMTDEDFPFVQKRFFEEYETWAEIKRMSDSDRARLLEIPRVKELVAAKAMSEKQTAPVPPAELRIESKAVPELPSPAQLRDRAAVQKQALADWLARRSRERITASDERDARAPA